MYVGSFTEIYVENVSWSSVVIDISVDFDVIHTGSTFPNFSTLRTKLFILLLPHPMCENIHKYLRSDCMKFYELGFGNDYKFLRDIDI